MFEIDGKQYSVDDLQKAAVKYGMDYNAYLSKMMEKGLKEIKPAKTEAVATETAPVTAGDQAVSTDLVSENGSSELPEPKEVELDLDNLTLEQYQNLEPAQKRKLSYRESARLRDLEAFPRKRSVKTDFSTNVFEELPTEEKLKLSDLARKEIVSRYKMKGVDDYEITEKEIEDRSKDILKDKRIEAQFESADLFGLSGEDETFKSLKSNAKRALGNLARVPTFLNEIATSAKRLFWTDEEKEAFDALDPKTQQLISNLSGFSANGMPIGAAANAGLKYYDEVKQEVAKVEETLTDFESTIGEDFASGRAAMGVSRAISGALSSIPSLVQAMVPYVGISSIVAGEAAAASGQAQEEGEKMDWKTIGYAGAVGLSEGVLELTTKKIGNGLFKNLKNAGSKDAVVKEFKNVLGKTIKDFNNEGLSESATLAINKLAEYTFLGREKAFENSFKEFVDTYIVGGTLGGGLSGGGGAFRILKQQQQGRVIKKELNESKYNSLSNAFSTDKTDKATLNLATNPNTEKFLDAELKKSVEDFEITTDEQAKIKENFIQTQSAALAVDKTDIISEDKAEAVDLLVEKKKRTDNIKAINDSALTQTELDRVKVIDEKLNVLASKGADIKAATALESDVAFAKKEGEVYGIKINSDLSRQEILDKYGKEYADSDGWIEGNEIFINKEVAAKTRAVTAGSHELLHGIIKNTILSSEDGSKIIDQFLSKLNPKQKEAVESRAKAVDAEGNRLYTDEYLAEKPDEYLTIFSDAILKNEIAFEETLGSKLKDFITPILRAVGFSKIKFDTGEQVYDFMKEYTKNVKKGKLSKAIKKQTKGDVKIDKKFSKTNKELGDEIKALVPEGTSKSRYDNQVIGNVYEKLVFGKTLDGLINGQLNKYGVVGDNVYGKPKDLFLEDVKAQLYEKSLMRFNPETNDDLGGFVVNELIKYRIGDVVNRYKKEAGVEGKSLDVAAGEVGSVQEVADESISIEDQIDLDAAKARSETRLTKATKILSKEQYDKAAKMVEEKLKDIDPKKLSYKKIGGLATDILSEITDVPAGKILDATKNLSKEETSRGAMFIEKNIDYIRKTLPKGAVQEAATEKLMGTATGVANSILKRLYDKNPRIKKGAGLSPWSIKPGITNQDILDAIGRPKREDGKKFQINPRSPEGQVIKGILNLVDRNIANELARTVESDLTLEQKQDVAAGKSSTMFSKSSQEILNKYDLDYKEIRTKSDVDYYISDMVKPLIGIFNSEDFKLLNRSVLQFRTKALGGDKKVSDYLRDELSKLDLPRRVTVGRTKQNQALGRTEKEFEKNLMSGKIDEYNERNSLVFSNMWNTINNVVSADKKLAIPIMYLLENSINEATNPHRMGAPVIGYEKGAGKLYYEHAVPSQLAYLNLMDSILNPKKDFQKEFEKIKQNYKVIAISESSNKKINDAKYGLVMPDNWKNWYDRYFNPKVASINKGINPENLIGIDGENFKSKFKIKSNGVKFSKSLNLDKEFNNIIENKTGIESYKDYKKVKAQVTGASKGKFNFFIAPSAEDFVGLLYKTLGKGEIGDAQMAWYKENLLDPYAKAMQKVSRDRNFMARNFLAIKKELKIVPKNLKKKIPGEPFTQEQAIRVYIWNKKGSTIPEISENDSIYLTNFVENNEKLKTFADQVIALSGLEDYAKPGDSWVTGTITTDMLEALNTTKRAKYLELWQQNADEIFSEKNLNKLEAAYGADYRNAMENILKRMKTGRNRAFGGDSLTGRFVDWMTGATGAIMFFNTRSAVLQTLSAVNFINFGDNNIFAAAKAFANQKQYWSDFKKLFNSDFLVERRDGLKINVNEADIADIAKEKGVRGLINKMLKLGFTPTQLADSFAIATGGATFYRNRLKSLIKDGMDPVAAEKQAMTDFRETAEESQQSSRPDKISAQQAGPLGRTILAFANTPAQYARIIKKAASDIKNGRGDLKTNVSKIMYYGVAQNLIFNALQQALFAALFDEDEEEIDDKTISIANGMADSILRGIGISGAIISVVKNAALRWVKEEEKANPKYENAILELTKISPPVSSKINKLRAASRSYSWDKKEMKEGGLSIDNPANLAIGNVVSAVTNIPLDRVVKKVQHIKAASDSEIDTYKRIFLLAGWSKWELGIKDAKKSKTKTHGTKKTYSKKKYYK